MKVKAKIETFSPSNLFYELTAGLIVWNMIWLAQQAADYNI